MGHIFLSYSHANKNIVHKIANRLKETQNIWIDIYNLKASDNLDREIANGIRDSSLFVCFISNEYCESDACVNEFTLAKKIKKTILPVMLQREATNGIELSISSLNTFYAFKPPNLFEPWSEDLYKKLLSNILEIISKEKNANKANVGEKREVVESNNIFEGIYSYFHE